MRPLPAEILYTYLAVMWLLGIIGFLYCWFSIEAEKKRRRQTEQPRDE